MGIFDYKTFWVLALVLVFSACQKDSTDDTLSEADRELLDVLETSNGLDYFTLPEGHELDKIPQDPNNPITNVKVELGKKLFFETGLAVTPNKAEAIGTYSCASCHAPGSCFQAGIRQGIGEGGAGFGIAGEGRIRDTNYEESELDIQPIRSPTAMHSAYNRTTLWNGQFGATGPNVGTEAQWTADTPKEVNQMGYEGVETQAIAGLGVHRMDANMTLIQGTYYKDLFDLAFPEFPESERYTKETIGLAMAAYERTILANKSPFQYWLKGDMDAMTEQQKLGALLFFGKAECVNCHTGPALNSEKFFALGMDDLEGTGVFLPFPEEVITSTHKGRGGFTGNPADDYKFKTPQIYALKAMKFLGHGASFTSIREIIEYKNAGVPENNNVPSSQLAAGFRPLGLSDAEIEQLVDFVENSLDDNDMERYTPNNIASGNCFPNNDPVSQDDMGCH